MRRALLLALVCAGLAWAVDPPVLLSPSSARATVGVRFAALLEASNAPTGFSASNLPPGLGIDGGGLISGQPTTAGSWTVTIGAANAGGAAPAATLTITVDAAGAGSVGNADLFRVSAGSACSLQLTSAMATPNFVASNLPIGLMDSGGGLVNGAPSTPGVAWVEVSADSGTTATVLSIDVRTATADTPVFNLPVQPQAASSAPFAFLLDATAGTAVVYGCSNLPAWLSLGSGLLSGTPAVSDTTINLKLSATAGTAAADTVLAIPINHPGTGAAIPASPAFLDATVGSGLGWLATASVGGAVFTAVDALPGGLDLQSGLLIGTPLSPGKVNVRFTATVDIASVPTDVTTTMAFRIADLTVGAPQIEALVPPTLTVLAPGALVVRTSVGTATTFSLNGPSGWSIDNTGLVTATPAAAGIVALRVTALNAAHQSSVTTIQARVVAADADAPLPSAPVILYATTGSPFAAVLHATPTATSWTALGLPVELPLTSNLGLISGTPVAGGDTNLQVTAISGSGSNTTSAVLRVGAAPTGAPVFAAVGPWYLTQGQPARIGLAATGASAWSLTGLPAGLSWNPSTGVISGTPSAAGSADLTVTASAGAAQATTTVAVVVSPLPSGAPVFTAADVLVGMVGTPFSATLSATGTTLGYTAAPLPAGLSLDAATGVISGTPTAIGSATVQVTAQNASGTVQTLVVIRISAPSGGVDPAVSGVSGGGCGAGTAGLLLLGGIALRRRRR